MTLSEVVSVSGQPGAFTVQVKNHPRYVDMDKCIACGLCAQKCPRKVKDEFNTGISMRRAIYMKYGQAVPLKYAIDDKNCLYLTRGKCRACEKFCPSQAINYDDREEIVDIDVGAVILAPGYTPFDPTGMAEYGYGKIPDVVTSLEYERMLSASGPYQGHLVRPSDHQEPKKIAWIQCVGSRNVNQCSNGYCSSVCCMYAIKQAMVTAEHLSGGEVQQSIFYMDIRTPGKGFEAYYEDAKAKGVQFMRARPYTMLPGENNRGVVMTYIDENNLRKTDAFDLVVLSVGLQAAADAGSLSDIFDFELNNYHFVQTGSFNPVATTRTGVYAAGAFHTPRAIPLSVMEASAAAADAATLLAEARGGLSREKTYPAARDTSALEQAIGVFGCSCGINIANTVDVNAVVEYAKTLPHVAYVENNLFTCSTDTQELIAEKIREHNLNRIVVAACTPRTHEPLFQDTLREAGLNPYLIEMANIRNHNAWVHQKEPEKATEKAKDQVAMAVARVAENFPLERGKVDVVQKALVVGAGISGMTAALEIADQGFETVLIEKSDVLGGNARLLNQTWRGEDVSRMLRDLISRVEKNQKIRLFTNAVLKSCSGSVGNFTSDVDINGKIVTVEYGAAVIATGAVEYRPNEYQFSKDRRIMTHLEFDAEIRDNESAVKTSNSVVFIQCVGSREQERPYCSRFCCSHSLISAVNLKKLNPAMNVYILFRDIRAYGEREDLYREARLLGVGFIRYEPENKPSVTDDNQSLEIRVFHTGFQRTIKIPADYQVLASAVVPRKENEIAELFKCTTNKGGFIEEAHPKLRPVDTPVDGVFVAGLCRYPKPVDECIIQAKAASARAGIILSKGVLQLDAVKSHVTENCDGCALCIDVCPYNALTLETVQQGDHAVRRIVSDKALCKGCGLCESTCPKGGITVHGFTREQILAQVDMILDNL